MMIFSIFIHRNWNRTNVNSRSSPVFNEWNWQFLCFISFKFLSKVTLFNDHSADGQSGLRSTNPTLYKFKTQSNEKKKYFHSGPEGEVNIKPVARVIFIHQIVFKNFFVLNKKVRAWYDNFKQIEQNISIQNSQAVKIVLRFIRGGYFVQSI